MTTNTLRGAHGPTWRRFAAPVHCYRLAGLLASPFAALAALLGAWGLYLGFVAAPTDFQQGEVYRIIFLHVPTAWLSMIIYVAMAFWAGLGWALNTRVSSMLASALAPSGALMCLLALITGALWGRPTWGAWWVWDARLSSELILLFLYIGFMALHAAFDDARRADRASALWALVGVVNVPIIYFSVRWWNTLHQGASVSLSAAPHMAEAMLRGMLVCTLALWSYAVAVVLWRLRLIIGERESGAAWLQAELGASFEQGQAA
ncbi:MAG: cytochrome c biogenesis protein CcsA [Burkholderiaceae bacterium]|nr:cytochrome c biogenesis protein CcsA [Burkholderiaceae bacterium]